MKKIYRTAIRPVMAYRKNVGQSRKDTCKRCVAQMRLFTWMCSKTRRERISTIAFGNIRGGDKLRVIHLRWIGHVKRTPAMAPMRKSFSIQIDGPSRKRVCQREQGRKS